MGMFTRINDIIQSNINALLDKAEDPEKMIRLIIQEMQETLVEIRTLAAQHIAEQKHLNRQIDNLEKRAAHWQENAELAVSKGKDDLARAALKEKKEPKEKKEALPRDEFGFREGSNGNLFMEALKQGPMKMSEIKEASWNRSHITFYELYNKLKAEGILDMNAEKQIFIVAKKKK